MQETQKAYWAGILDGEGCVNITTTKPKDRITPYHFLRIMIYNSKRELLEKAKREFGCGTIQTHKSWSKVLNYQGKIIFAWGASTRDAEKCLRILLPYLFLKKKQAELALEFQEAKSTKKGKMKGGVYYTLSKEELAKRARFAQGMKTLNA